MDVETIKKINRKALADAKAGLASGKRASDSGAGLGGSLYGSVGGSLNVGGGKNNLMKYMVALVVALLVYFILRSYKPDFVMKTKDNVKEFDEMKGLLFGVGAGVVVLLLYSLNGQ